MNKWLLQDEIWCPAELREAVILHGEGVSAAFGAGSRLADSDALIYPTATSAGQQRWVLLAAPQARVRVNGEYLHCGMRVLTDRDAVHIPGQSVLFFSTESLASIQPFDGDADCYCPRCKLAIAAGTPAVRCPGCGVWHHEHDEVKRRCWTYAKSCALCDQDSSLESRRFRWTPEDLWV